MPPVPPPGYAPDNYILTDVSLNEIMLRSTDLSVIRANLRISLATSMKSPRYEYIEDEENILEVFYHDLLIDNTNEGHRMLEY